jgi:hypothetical protein
MESITPGAVEALRNASHDRDEDVAMEAKRALSVHESSNSAQFQKNSISSPESMGNLSNTPA